MLSSRLWFGSVIATVAMVVGLGVPIDAASAVSRSESTGEGEWVDVNTSVSRDGDVWRVEDHPLFPVFRGGDDEAPAVTVTRDGYDVSFSLVGAEPADVDASFWWWDDREELTYRDVSGGADLEYRVEPGGVKESLILDAAPANRSSWTWA